MSFSRLFAASLGLLLIGLAASCSSGGSTPGRALLASDVNSTSTVTLSAPAGSVLEGFQLQIPKGALPDAVTIRLFSGTPTAQAGLKVVGPAATVTPSPLDLVLPVTLRMPFDPDLITSARPRDFRVQRRGSDGEVTELIPDRNNVDLGAGIVEIQISSFSTFWVTVPDDGRPAPLVIDLEEYFPFGAGDTYEFDGFRLRVGDVPSNSILSGSVIRALIRERGNNRDSIYMRRETNGDVTHLGYGTETFFSGSEEVYSANPWLPSSAEESLQIFNDGTLVAYSPIGNAIPDIVGDAISRTFFFSVPGGVDTPAGFFADVVRMERFEEVTQPGGTELRSFRIWFARGVGPIGLRFEDEPLQLLQGGAVGGNPIGG